MDASHEERPHCPECGEYAEDNYGCGDPECCGAAGTRLYCGCNTCQCGGDRADCVLARCTPGSVTEGK